MTNISNTPSVSQDYEANLQLSYDYLDKSIKEIQDIINNTNSQLGILVGFNLTFIRFFINELPSKLIVDEDLFCNSCLLLKIFTYGLAIASIILALIGLYQTTELKIIKPNVLIENCEAVLNSELKLAIMDSFQDKLENFRQLAVQKKQIFNRSILLLLGSGLIALIDQFFASIY